MLIGELSMRTDVSIRSVRHYEAQGLVHAERLDNGYRVYSEKSIDRVRRIRVLLESGCSIREIRQFLPCLEEEESFDPQACQAGLDRHLKKLAEIDELMANLSRRRRSLLKRLARFGVPAIESRMQHLELRG